MATAPENRRTDSIRVRLAPEMMERFEHLASRYGMPPATLCAFAVARFVQQEETNAQLTRMAVLDASRKSGERLEEVFSEDNMEKIMGPMFKALMEQMQPELTQALQQKSLPLDGEASREDA
jgi:predicted transcriptional regulator